MITLLSYVGTFIVGAAAGYLVLRNNPKVKAALDAKTDEVAAKIHQE